VAPVVKTGFLHPITRNHDAGHCGGPVIFVECRPLPTRTLELACVNYARTVRVDLLIAKEGLTIEQPIFGSTGRDEFLLLPWSCPLSAC
jgi:hypothetical protein